MTLLNNQCPELRVKRNDIRKKYKNNWKLVRNLKKNIAYLIYYLMLKIVIASRIFLTA